MAEGNFQNEERKCWSELRLCAFGVRSVGSAHLTVRLKMLLPTLLDTAMFGRPLRVTITLVMRSGWHIAVTKIPINLKAIAVSPIYKKNVFSLT